MTFPKRATIITVLSVVSFSYLALLIVNLLLWSSPTGVVGTCVKPRQAGYCVVDGDTIKWNGWSIRIAGIDAPEIRSPECPEERELGYEAQAHLSTVLSFAWVAQLPSRWMAGPSDYDNFGRLLSDVRVSDWALNWGESVGSIMMAAGYAVPYGKGTSWCETTEVK
jgi:endonuclease YncB( thermonuclease family)